MCYVLCVMCLPIPGDFSYHSHSQPSWWPVAHMIVHIIHTYTYIYIYIYIYIIIIYLLLATVILLSVIKIKIKSLRVTTTVINK
jgi:hypothetical protein